MALHLAPAVRSDDLSIYFAEAIQAGPNASSQILLNDLTFGIGGIMADVTFDWARLVLTPSQDQSSFYIFCYASYSSSDMSCLLHAVERLKYCEHD